MRLAPSLPALAALSLLACVGEETGVITRAVVVRTPLRAPAVPIAVRDAYLNVWSLVDDPTSDVTRDWMRTPRPLTIVALVDGKPMGLLGTVGTPAAMPLERVEVRPSRTTYEYAGGGVSLLLSFVTPLLPLDDEAMALPGVWIESVVTATDGRAHDVALYVAVGGAWARADARGMLTWRAGDLGGGVKALFAEAAPGTEKVYTEIVDWPDWGQVFLAAKSTADLTHQIGAEAAMRAAFMSSGRLAGTVETDFRPSGERPVALALAYGHPRLMTVDRRRLFLGMARERDVRFQDEDCIADWRFHGNLDQVVVRALDGAEAWRTKIEANDARVVDAAMRAGGSDYAALVTMAYRQTFGANERCRVGGTPYLFQKEISSGSYIQTVDVIYPTMPMLLHENPRMLKEMLEPLIVLDETLGFGTVFAPHALGLYPRAENNTHATEMPVECSGDMLIMAAAYTRYSGDLAFVRDHEARLKRWADYLIGLGVMSPPQLSTDDFTGLLGNSANLGVKAVLAVAAFAQIEEKLGRAGAGEYRARAEDMMQDWLALAVTGDHTNLVLGSDGWSLKYNLYIDRLLDLRLVPGEVMRNEAAWYRGKVKRFGTPLDSRFNFTKADWLTWVAVLTDDPQEFQAMIAPVARMLDETPERAAFTDIYDVETGKRPWEFTARPVVGAVAARMLLARDSDGGGAGDGGEAPADLGAPPDGTQPDQAVAPPPEGGCHVAGARRSGPGALALFALLLLARRRVR